MDFITFNGNDYPIVSCDIKEVGEVTIATTDLEDELLTSTGDYVSKDAREIDEGIYYFVDPDAIYLSESELAALVEKEAA